MRLTIARSIALGVGALSVIAACSKLAGIDDLTIDDCFHGACIDASHDGPIMPMPDGAPPEGGDVVIPDGPYEAAPCPDASAPPTLVRAGPPYNSFCIDRTEVTYGMYGAFLTAKNGDTSGQAPECVWNDSYIPANGMGPANDPVTQVDWCDAWAYCRWAGKRLCGKIVNGKDPGVPLQESELFDVSVHEWRLACTFNGAQPVPYGASYVKGACNVDLDAGPKAAGSLKGCEGGYAGLFDLVGNAYEWIDSCRLQDAGPQMDICWFEGGSFTSKADEAGVVADCTTIFGSARNAQLQDVGFRCCSL